MNEQRFERKHEELADICRTTEGSAVLEMKLDGKIPHYVVYPSNGEETAKVLSLAARTRTPVAIVGGGSKFNCGRPLTNLEWALSTVELRQDPVIKADDLTVNVMAGLTLSELQNRLHEYNLFLPVDPGTSRTTIGGVLASGGGGSQRLKFGLVRDFVLGITVALTDGKVYKFGGQTVKNVAGYDISKLFIGSNGTLGVIVGACLRVYPIPPSSKVLLGAVRELDTAWKVVGAIEEIQPTVIELYDMVLASRLNRLDKPGNCRYAILVKYSGVGPVVDKQCADTLSVFESCGIKLAQVREDIDNEIWQQRCGIVNTVDDVSQGLIGIKVSVPRVKIRQMAERLEQVAGQFNINKVAVHMPTVGISYVQCVGKNQVEFVNNFREVVKELGGLVQLRTGDIQVRQKFQTGFSTALDSHIKDFFDPENVLNPGKCP